MGVSTEARAAVRAAHGGRCGYCGVPESSVGGELEIDHFHPQAAGGADDVESHLSRVLQAQEADLQRAQEAEARLKQENDALQIEIDRLRTAIAMLLRGGEP